MNRAVVVLRRFYCALIAMGYLEHNLNPMLIFPSIKAVPRKLISLSQEQISRLLSKPKPDTVFCLPDRALLALLYGTRIRASECTSLRNHKVDLKQLSITVPSALMNTYVQAPGPASFDRDLVASYRAVESLSV